ncbi:nickel-responsive transcriptional regulator NikR [bacterium]|nr:nickel-responsive transcriptional regulator NikR [bacterium]
MGDLIRMSITMEKHLYEHMQNLLQLHGYENRSEFIRDMLRSRLVELEWERDRTVIGTITMVYDHDQRELNRKLMELQHQMHDNILATTHVHLDHNRCVEAVMIRGGAGTIQRLANQLRQQKGVLHVSLSMSTLGAEFRAEHPRPNHAEKV